MNNSSKIKVGARWDDQNQYDRFVKAISKDLLEYVEVNYPILKGDKSSTLKSPIYVHNSNTPISSAYGLNMKVANIVRNAANKHDSPWIGEHLGMLGCSQSGSLGYLINNLYTYEFAEIAIKNTKKLLNYYQRPLALELGPIYTVGGDFKSELDFINHVATKSDAYIILDIAHWTISNKNLGRAIDYGLDQLDKSRVIELHIAGIKKSSSSKFWHDAHYEKPSRQTFELLKEALRFYPNVRGVTLEHDPRSNEKEFLALLEKTNKMVK